MELQFFYFLLIQPRLSVVHGSKGVSTAEPVTSPVTGSYWLGKDIGSSVKKN